MRYDEDDEPTIEQLAAKMTKAEMLQILGSMIKRQTEEMVRELLSVQGVYSEDELRAMTYLELCDVHTAVVGALAADDDYDYRPPDIYNIWEKNPAMARSLGLRPRK